ncbi:hypothetical protein PQR72_24410 [Paraburkholderia madseniana]|uniref:hypothetical protein n=1 Tax=Paraburkholderia madseniana TaxID=2599607 RepID=UPI0015C54D28|nr:hypothetical protein [Paraburkholderia madseniana]NPT67401.1 hypothetical protein [Paraburkholderia madseniana]
MTNDNGSADGHPEQVPESLRTLAEYLERALDSATSIVMMRPADGVCIVYLGDPAGLREDLKQIGTIANSLANDMLESTFSGANQLQISGQIYRFARSFTQVDDMAAVVFSTE